MKHPDYDIDFKPAIARYDWDQTYDVLEFVHLPQGFDLLMQQLGIPAFELMAIDRYTYYNYLWCENYSDYLYQFLKVFNYSPNTTLYATDAFNEVPEVIYDFSSLSEFKGLWRSNQTYGAGDIIIWSDDNYRANLSHSSDVFTPSQWTRITPQNTANINNFKVTTPSFTYENKYSKTEQYIVVLPKGKYQITALIYQYNQEGLIDNINTINQAFIELNIESDNTELDLNKIINHWVGDNYPLEVWKYSNDEWIETVPIDPNATWFSYNYDSYFCVNSLIISRLNGSQWQSITPQFNNEKPNFLLYSDITDYFNEVKDAIYNYLVEKHNNYGVVANQVNIMAYPPQHYLKKIEQGYYRQIKFKYQNPNTNQIEYLDGEYEFDNVNRYHTAIMVDITQFNPKSYIFLPFPDYLKNICALYRANHKLLSNHNEYSDLGYIFRPNNNYWTISNIDFHALLSTKYNNFYPKYKIIASENRLSLPDIPNQFTNTTFQTLQNKLIEKRYSQSAYPNPISLFDFTSYKIFKRFFINFAKNALYKKEFSAEWISSSTPSQEMTIPFEDRHTLGFSGSISELIDFIFSDDASLSMFTAYLPPPLNAYYYSPINFDSSTSHFTEITAENSDSYLYKTLGKFNFNLNHFYKKVALSLEEIFFFRVYGLYKALFRNYEVATGLETSLLSLISYVIDYAPFKLINNVPSFNSGLEPAFEVLKRNVMHQQFDTDDGYTYYPVVDDRLVQYNHISSQDEIKTQFREYEIWSEEEITELWDNIKVSDEDYLDFLLQIKEDKENG